MSSQVEYYIRRFAVGHSWDDSLTCVENYRPERVLPRVGEYVCLPGDPKERKVISVVHLIGRDVIQVFLS